MDKYISPSKLQRGDAIGKGTFGVVLRGKFLNQSGIWQDVAIKQSVNDTTSLPSSSSGATPDEQFVKEVSFTVDISKDADHVVQCHGWTAMRDGKLALVMGLYEKSLYTFIDEQGGRALPLQVVVKIALDIAKGLLELHTKRIVFEDMKPSNVLLDVASRAFLADFGVSKPMKDMTKVYTKHATGTCFYMPPEKLGPRSVANVRVGYAADIWSYGVTVLQLLCSDLEAPYGPGFDVPDIVFMLHVDKERPSVPAVPEAPELQHILQACLTLDYNQRPSAAQLVQALERISCQLGAATSTSVNATQGSAAQDVRVAEDLRAQLAAAEGRAAAAERKLAEEAQQKQEMAAREAQMQKQRAADAQRGARTAGAQPKQALKLLSTPAHTSTLSGHTHYVRSVAFTPNGTSLVSGSADHTVKVWDLASGRCTATLEGHSNWVRSVAVSVDGRTVASGSDDKSVKLWDLDSRHCRATLTGHSGSVLRVTFSPDGATFASASGDHTIRLWNASTGMHKATLKGSNTVYGVAFSPDSMRLASGDAGNIVWLWDVRSGKSIAKLDEGHGRVVHNVVFSLDGTHVLSSSDRTICVWDTNTKACKRTMTGPCDWVKGVALTPDGAYAVSGMSVNFEGCRTIKIWDWQRGVCVATLQCDPGPPLGLSPIMAKFSMAVSPDGRTLAGGHIRNITLWTIAE